MSNTQDIALEEVATESIAPPTQQASQDQQDRAELEDQPRVSHDAGDNDSLENYMQSKSRESDSIRKLLHDYSSFKTKANWGIFGLLLRLQSFESQPQGLLPHIWYPPAPDHNFEYGLRSLRAALRGAYPLRLW